MSPRKRTLPILALAPLVLIVIACGPLITSEDARPSPSPPAPTARSLATTTPTPTAPSTPSPAEPAVPNTHAPKSTATPPAVLVKTVRYGYTHQQPDGNRLVSGRGALPETQPLNIPLDGLPHWLVAAPMAGGSVWVAVLADGRVQAFHVVGDRASTTPVTPARLSPGAPPLLEVRDDSPRLIVGPTGGPSSLTHPIVLDPSAGRLAFLEASGDLVIWERSQVARLAVQGLPDARLLVDQSTRLLLLTDPTARYAHSVLGDGLEAASVTLLETSPDLHVARRIVIPSPQVVEAIAPIWADLTGDGQREIVLTVSDAEQGAQIVVYGEDGQPLAAGPAIGRGYRWNHQLVVAPFGPNGELELATVQTPHIGGIVQFYRLTGDRLEMIARVTGYTSHVISTRNLDMAVAGDLDGDGRIELLLPDQARTNLGAIRRDPEGANVAWTIPVDGKVTTNLAAVALPDATLAVGVGHDGHGLSLWLP